MQAPVGPAATPDLVAAVCRTGALGTLAASWAPVCELREQIRSLRAGVDAPFCVNLVLAFEQRERLLAVLEEGTPVVSFSWGVDAELVRLAHEAGASVLVQVGDVGEATTATAAGADGLIVQGVEAGGHVQASGPLNELLREIRPQLRLPFVAAGGIADDESAKDALDSGADAIACGTLFLAAAEADVHPTYLDRLVGADDIDTRLTTLFDGGWPNAQHRVIRNETFDAWEAAGMPARGFRPGEEEPVALRDGRPVLRYDDAQPTGGTTGNIAAMAMYAGTSARAVDRQEPASRIVERLIRRIG
jgi:nitronate monooxygenase